MVEGEIIAGTRKSEEIKGQEKDRMYLVQNINLITGSHFSSTLQNIDTTKLQIQPIHTRTHTHIQRQLEKS